MVHFFGLVSYGPSSKFQILPVATVSSLERTEQKVCHCLLFTHVAQKTDQVSEQISSEFAEEEVDQAEKG